MKWKSQVLTAHDLVNFHPGWVHNPEHMPAYTGQFTRMINEPTVQIWVRIKLQARPGDVLLWLFYDPEEE